MRTRFTELAGVEVPLLCGPMYPCSNPELVAAVSEAGGLGIIQPLSLVYVHKLAFQEGLRRIRSLTKKPVGLNILTEKSLSAVYRKRMEEYLETSLAAGIRFFITALGNPDWVVKRAHAAGAVVFHDVVDRKWAEKGMAEGVDGLICVNSRAGGHAGRKTPQELHAELSDLGVPLVCAGGVGSEAEFRAMLDLGYAAVQMGTRFIATEECTAHRDYKEAILDAEEKDIVMTERITGVPLSIIRTPFVERMGTKAGPIGRWMLSGRRRKHWMRAIYSVRSAFQLKNASMKGASSKDFWQAGKSVATIRTVEPAAAIVRRFAAAAG
ncbi:MAG TPA: nitronate monooxygenase [Thermoanaerobaculia bacterium]|nr:nitronate monooxygenase [Thermoanaerobaculia bacterium]